MDALLERLAAVYYALAGLVILLAAPRARALGAAGLALVGLAAAAAAAALPGSSGAYVTINELIALSGIAVVAGALLSAWRDTGEHDSFSPPNLAAAPVSAPPDPLLLAALLLTALAPHLLLLGLGVALALASVARAAVRPARPAALLILLAAGLSLGAGLVLLFTILGPEGGRLAGIAEGPTSLAAERLLTLLFGVGTFLVAGLPPLHRLPWGRQLAPLAAILLGRVVAPGFPAGLLTWQVPAMLLGVAGTLWSALAGRWAQVAVGGGFMALWSGAEAMAVGGVLVAWGWLVETGTAIAAPRGVALAARWRGIPALPAALAALPALTAGLRVQVVLSVATVGACVAGLLMLWKRRTRPLQPPLY